MYDVRKLEYEIDENWEGKTVKALLQHEGFSSAVISGLKKNPKGIMLGNKRITVLKQLHAGDKLTLRIRNRPESEEKDRILPMDLPIEILYEDEDIAVVNKPADMPTHPVQNNHEKTLANAMAFHWMQAGKKYIYRPVSRLDKDTTGAIIIAKNSYAAGKLSTDLKNRWIHRSYFALVNGILDGEGVIDAPIVRCENSVIKRKVVSKDQETEKSRAITRFRSLATEKDRSLLLVQLETGKTHQIRVHMASIGHPLCGDWLYGIEHYITDRPALHSYMLEFTHPVSGENMKIIAPIPEDIRKAIEAEPKI